MTCAQLVDCLDAYVDRELDERTELAAREHLATCSGCRRLVAERETLGRLVRSVPYYAAPDRVSASEPSRAIPDQLLRTWTLVQTSPRLTMSTRILPGSRGERVQTG